MKLFSLIAIAGWVALLGATEEEYQVRVRRQLRFPTLKPPSLSGRSGSQTGGTSGTGSSGTGAIGSFLQNAAKLLNFTGSVSEAGGGLAQGVLQALDPRQKRAYGFLQRHVNVSKFDFDEALPGIEDIEEFLDIFKDIPEIVREAYINMTKDPGSVDPRLLRKLPLMALSVLKSDVLNETILALGRQAQIEICRRIAMVIDDYMSLSRVSRVFDCRPIWKSHQMEPKDEAIGIVNDARRMEHPPSDWSNADWIDFLDFVEEMDAVDIAHAPPGVIGANLRRLGELDEVALASVLDILKVPQNMGGLGGLARLTSENIKDMKDYLEDFPPEDVRSLDGRAVRESFRDMAPTYTEMEGLAKESVREVLESVLPDPFNWTEADIENGTLMLFSCDIDVLDRLPDNVFLSGIKELREPLSRVESRNMLERMEMTPGYDMSRNWTATMMREMGGILSAITPSIIRHLRDGDVRNVIDVFGKADLAGEKAAMIMEKWKNGTMLQDVNATTLARLGKMLRGLRIADLKNLSSSALQGAINSSEALNMLPKRLRRALLMKIKKKLVRIGMRIRDFLEEHEDFMELVPVQELAKMNDTELGLDDSDSPIMMRFTPEQARQIIGKIKNRFGEFSNSSYTLERYVWMGSAVFGIECDDIKMIPAGSQALSIIEHISKMLQEADFPIPDAMEVCLSHKALSFLKLMKQRSMKIEKLHVKQLCYTMKHWPRSYLEALIPVRLRSTVGQCLGKSRYTNVKRSQIVEVFTSIVGGKNATGQTLTKNDLYDVGNAICGITESHIQLMDAGAIRNYGNRLARKCDLPPPEGRALLNKMVQAFNIQFSQLTLRQCVQLGPAAVYLSGAQLQQIPAKMLCSCIGRLQEEFEDKKEVVKERVKNGLDRVDLTAADKQEMKEGWQRLLVAVRQALQTCRQQRQRGVGRRRRSVAAPTCSDIELLGDGAVSLTAAELMLMSDVDFIDCVERLGQIEGWAADQLAELVALAKKPGTFDAVNTWSTSEIVQIGSIAQGLTSAELGQLTLTQLETIAELGQYSGWTDAQLSAVFAKWLADSKSNNATAVEYSELQDLGQFACGATPTHISAMTPTTYSFAASEIGELGSCSETQLAAWAAHALTVFGSTPSSWSNAWVGTVGAVIGGLSQSQVQSLSSAQVQSLSAAAIAALPTASFAKLSESQLSNLSPTQAWSVTADQQAGLSASQLSGLQSAGATAQVSDGAANLLVSAVPLILFSALSVVVY